MGGLFFLNFLFLCLASFLLGFLGFILTLWLYPVNSVLCVTMTFSPLLQLLFLCSIVTATAATDAPPAPPVAGIAAAALPAPGPPVREKKRKGRVNKDLVSAAPVGERRASSVTKDVKKMPQNQKPQPAKSAPVPQKKELPKALALRLTSGTLYHPFRTPTVAMLKQLINHRLSSLSKPWFPSYHPTTKAKNLAGKLVNKPLRFGHPLTKKFEVDLTSPATGKKVGNIYHPAAKIIPHLYCAHAKLTGARYIKPLTCTRPADFVPNTTEAQAEATLKRLHPNSLPIPSEGADVMAGASGAARASEMRLERLERRMMARQPADEMTLLQSLIHGKEITNRNVIDICRNILLPGQCANIGTPNNNNGRPAIRPTIATRYKVPFADNKVAILIQDSLSEVLRIVGGGTGSYRVPILTNSAVNGRSGLWNWDGPTSAGWDAGAEPTPSYITASTRSTFKFSHFPVYSLSNETELIPQDVTVVGTDSSKKDIQMIPFLPTSQLSFVAGVGSNVTAAGFRVVLYVVRLVNGIYSLTTITADLQGGAIAAGVIAKADWSIPVDAVGLYEISIENLNAGTVTLTAAPQVEMVLTGMSSDVVIPAGKADGTDFQFFATYMPQVLIDTLAAKFMFWAGFDENVEVTFGQFDEDEDGDIPPPTFDSWAALTRFRTKPMNDPSENGAYVPMIRRDMDAYNFRDVSTAEAEIIGEQLGAYMDSTGADGEHVIAEVMMGVTACGLIQGVDPKSGIVDVDALSIAFNLLRQEVFATGNDDHENEMANFLLTAAKTLTAPSGDVNINFSGWLSGNDVTVV
jgi:hypothetical protein